MGTHEYKEEAAAASIFQDNSDILSEQNESSSSSNLLHKLIEKQANQFEEFGKRMSAQLQTSYQEYIKQQDEFKIENNFEKICNVYQTKIDSQSELINSLKTRIEELETDSIIKTQDIKKLRQDFTRFLELKKLQSKEAKSKSGPFNDTCSEGTEGTKNCKGPMWADSGYDKSLNWGDSVENENFVNILKSSNTTRVESAHSSSSQMNSISQSSFKLEQIHAKVQQIITRSENLGKEVAKKHFKILANDFTRNDLTQYTNSGKFHSLKKKAKRYINNLIKKMLEDEEGKPVIDNANMYEGSIWKDNSEDVKEEILEQLHSLIQQTITQKENNGVRLRLRNFKVLNNSFTTNDLIQYTKTNKFKSLGDVPKRLLNLLIYDSLSEEFERQNVVFSQNLEEYTKRGVIPKLPLGYNNYTMYEKSIMFNSLSKFLRRRVRKVIILEKIMLEKRTAN